MDMDRMPRATTVVASGRLWSRAGGLTVRTTGNGSRGGVVGGRRRTVVGWIAVLAVLLGLGLPSSGAAAASVTRGGAVRGTGSAAAWAGTAGVGTAGVGTAGMGTAGVGSAYGMVRLPSGERLLRGGDQEWSLLDRSLTGAQVLRVGARMFVLPRSVQPLLGTVLDPNLFDVNAIAAHRDGLPVTVRFAPGHEQAGVPGVVITARSGATATGRITAGSSAALGRYLRIRTAAELFAGIVRVERADAARSATSGRYPMHTLTVSVTGADGRPLASAMAGVVCVDDPNRFVTVAPVRNGRLKVSVPTGIYAVFTQSDVTPTDVRVALSPEFTVAGDRRIGLDLRRATTHLRSHTAEPTTITSRVTLLRRTYEMTLDGQTMHLLFDLGAIDDGAFDVAFTPTPKPRFGTQDLYQFVDAHALGGMAAGRFALLFGHAGDVPTHDIVQVADDSNLATFHTSLYGPTAMTSGRFSRGAMPAGGGWGYTELIGGPMRLRERATAAPGVDVGASYFQDVNADAEIRGDFEDFDGVLSPGAVLTSRLGRAPLHGGFYAPADLGVCVNCTDGTSVNLFVRSGDDADGHGSMGDSTLVPDQTWQVSADGREIASGSGPAMTGADLPVGARTLAVDMTLDRAVAPFDSSTHIATRWTLPLRTSRPAPAGIDCPLSGTCRTLPFLTARYAVPTDLYGVVAAGQRGIVVTLGRLGGGASPVARSIDLRIDYGPGSTRVPLTALGGGRYAATLTVPAAGGGRVAASLQFSAATSDGATLSERIDKAFLLAP